MTINNETDLVNLRFRLDGVTDEWLAEYNNRADEANILYDLIERGLVTEETFWSEPGPYLAICAAMEYQVLLKFPDGVGDIGTISKAEPLVEGKDWVIETRNGKFGVWGIEESA